MSQLEKENYENTNHLINAHRPPAGLSLLDSEGTVLAQFDRQVIEPGKMMSFDFVWGESNRIQIRVVISGDTLRGLLTSTEVFENDTGKTTVFVAVGK